MSNIVKWPKKTPKQPWERNGTRWAMLAIIAALIAAAIAVGIAFR